MTLPFPRQFSKGGNPLTDELFFFEQERVKGWVADDQCEYLGANWLCNEHLIKLLTNRTTKLQISASTSQDPVITASGARYGRGHRILGEGSPERKAEPKSMIFILQLFDSSGERGSVEGSTRYCGEWLVAPLP